MLKSILHISLSVLLLFANAGIIISKHYCHGNLVSIAVDHEAEPCCSMGNCCHNETVFYQVKEDFSTPQIVYPPVQVIVDLFGIELNENLFTEIGEEDIEVSTEYEYPPPKPVHSKLAEVQSYLL